MDVAELAEVGAKIVEIGEKLKTLRGQRDEINVQISAYEKELMPLVVQHQKIIAEVIGTPVVAQPVVPRPPPPQPGPGPNANGGAVAPDAMAQAKKRIAKFLEDAEPGVSAHDVSEALKMDPYLVRQVMADFARSGK